MESIKISKTSGTLKTKEASSVADIFKKSSKLARSPPGTPLAIQHTGALTPKSNVAILNTPDGSTTRAYSGNREETLAGDCTPSMNTTPRPLSHFCTSLEESGNSHHVKDSMVREPIGAHTESVKYDSPRQELINKMRNMEEDAISQCKLVLGGMQRATSRQKNISNEVKDGISKIAELLDVIANYRRTWKAAEEEKTLLNRLRKGVEQQMRDTVTPKAAKSKRAATSPAVPESSKKARAKEKNVNLEEVVQTNSGDHNNESNWQTVIKKHSQRRKEKSVETNKAKKIRPQRVKPEAVIIKPAEGHSYAEVLKGLRNKITTSESDKIRSIRKTVSGAILLEFGKGEKINTDFVQKLKGTVRETASIAELRQRATVEIRDLDSLTNKEEVEMAVRQLLDNPKEQLQTRLTVPNTREQVRAFVTLPAESAAKLVRNGYTKVGLIRAKMRICESIRRCYRCFGTGHAQTSCNGPDRRDRCIRCGETGHKMKDCNAAPKCVNCTDAQRDRTDHLPGSNRCPLVKRI